MKFFNDNQTIRSGAAETRRILSGEMALLRRKRNSMIILLLLFVCMVFWGVASIFSSQHASKIKPETKALATPLNPVIDTKIFGILESKRLFTDEELADFEIYKLVIDGRSGKETIEEINTQPAPSSIPKR